MPPNFFVLLYEPASDEGGYRAPCTNDWKGGLTAEKDGSKMSMPHEAFELKSGVPT